MNQPSGQAGITPVADSRPPWQPSLLWPQSRHHREKLEVMREPAGFASEIPCGGPSSSGMPGFRDGSKWAGHWLPVGDGGWPRIFGDQLSGFCQSFGRMTEFRLLIMAGDCVAIGGRLVPPTFHTFHPTQLSPVLWSLDFVRHDHTLRSLRTSSSSCSSDAL